MFRPFNKEAAKKSVYLNKENPFPPRTQMDCPARQKLTDNVLNQICLAHPTNKIPKDFKADFKQTFSDLEVSSHLDWLTSSAGESKWLFMTGLYNVKHSRPSKIILGTVEKRVMLLDLRTVSTSGGVPDVLCHTLEKGQFVPVGENIKRLLEHLNLSVRFCIDTLEVINHVINDNQQLFRLPPRCVDSLIIDHWVLGCLWYEEFLGYATKEEFHEFAEYFPHPQVRYWPWSKEEAGCHWGLLVTGVQAAFARNHVLLDLVVLLTYTLQELGSHHVAVGPAGPDFEGAQVVSASVNWEQLVDLLTRQFRKSGEYQGPSGFSTSS